jgi:hypothetical protein
VLTFARVLIALFAALLCGVAHADKKAETRALDVTSLEWKLDTTRIVLGETATVQIALTAKKPDGTPLDVAPPRLSASTGALSAPVRTAPGAWTTTFTPPKEMFPHVAIVFATIETAGTTAVGFAPLHLWGKGQTSVKTKPGSKVTVFIGNESFGPVDADKNGEANVSIVVPPGPERAVAKSIDDVGNESQKTIDLGVPGFNRLAMLALDDVASADGAARILAFAVDKKGEPLFEAKLKTKGSIGELEEPVGIAPGLFLLTYKPGKSAARGIARIDVSLEGAPESKAQTEIKLLTGRPVRADIATATTKLTADDPREVVLELHLYDQSNNAVPVNAASIDVDIGRIDSMSDLDGLGRRITWLIPAELKPGMDKATASVRLPDGTILGKREIPLLPGKPVRAFFDPTVPVVADGKSTVELRLHVVDAAGNGLVPTGVNIDVDRGYGELVAPAVDGRSFKIVLIPEPRDQEDVAVVKGSALGVSTTAEVSLKPRPRAWLLVGPGIVAGWNYGQLTQAGPDLSLLVRLPGFDGSTHAGLSVSMLQSIVAPTGVDHRSYPVFLEGAWRPLIGPDVALHIGAAAGFVLTDEVRTDARTVLPGVAGQAVLGAARRLGTGFLELDLRAGYGVTFPGADVGAPVGLGAVLNYRFGI